MWRLVPMATINVRLTGIVPSWTSNNQRHCRETRSRRSAVMSTANPSSTTGNAPASQFDQLLHGVTGVGLDEEIHSFNTCTPSRRPCAAETVWRQNRRGDDQSHRRNARGRALAVLVRRRDGADLSVADPHRASLIVRSAQLLKNGAFDGRRELYLPSKMWFL
jgi:hypothetical protein